MYTAHYHCHVCHTQYLPGQTECTNCANAKQDILIVINHKKAITRVLKSKCYKLNALLMFIYSALFCAGNCEDLIISPESKDTILADIHDGKRGKDISHRGIRWHFSLRVFSGYCMALINGINYFIPLNTHE